MTESKPRRWVFLRGLARHSLHWGPFVECFKEFFPLDQVEFLDARGNGSQSHIPSYTSIGDNVRDLRSRSELLKQGPIHLFTISLGSMMGIQWATEFPQDIEKLVVINTSDSRNSKFYERLSLSNLPYLLGAILNSEDNLKVERNIMRMVAPNLRESEKWIKKFASVPPTSKENLARQLMAASQFKLPHEKPRCPLLILASRGDGFVSPQCTERIARAWNQNPVWHTSAGHELPLEEPRWVCEQLKKFVFEDSSQAV